MSDFSTINYFTTSPNTYNANVITRFNASGLNNNILNVTRNFSLPSSFSALMQAKEKAVRREHHAQLIPRPEQHIAIKNILRALGNKPTIIDVAHSWFENRKSYDVAGLTLSRLASLKGLKSPSISTTLSNMRAENVKYNPEVIAVLHKLNIKLKAKKDPYSLANAWLDNIDLFKQHKITRKFYAKHMNVNVLKLRSYIKIEAELRESLLSKHHRIINGLFEKTRVNHRQPDSVWHANKFTLLEAGIIHNVFLQHCRVNMYKLDNPRHIHAVKLKPLRVIINESKPIDHALAQLKAELTSLDVAEPVLYSDGIIQKRRRLQQDLEWRRKLGFDSVGK